MLIERNWLSDEIGRVNDGEVGRTASNLNELEHPLKRENNREKPMNYEEWSKSIELDRTLTLNFVGREITEEPERV